MAQGQGLLVAAICLVVGIAIPPVLIGALIGLAVFGVFAEVNAAI